MGRRLALVLALLSLTAPLAAATPWLGLGGGPMRSFATPDTVPAVREVAFRLELPANLSGSAQRITEPLVLDSSVYVLAADGVHRVSLADATSERIASIPEDAGRHLVSDGERLFVETLYGVKAFRVDGSLRWETEFPALVAGSPVTRCSEPVTGAGALFLHCFQADEDLPASELPGVPGVRGIVGAVSNQQFLVAYDLATGEERWRVVESDARSVPLPSFLAFVDGVLVVQWLEYRDAQIVYFMSRRLDAVDPADGTVLWSDARDLPLRGTSAGEVEVPLSGKRQGPLGSGRSVYALLNDLRRYDARGGEVEWSVPFDEKTHAPRFAEGEDGLVVAWGARLWRMDAEGVAGETVGFLEGTRMWNGLAAADGAVVGVAHDMRCSPNPGDDPNPEDCQRWVPGADDSCADEPGRAQWLHVYHDDGSHWTDELCAVDPDFALAEGLIVMSAYPRTIAVYGRTAASIGLVTTVSDAYPAPGETVTIDVGATTPGVLAEDVEFHVDWGDGTVSEPQTEPVFTHVYEEAGDRVAVVTAMNSANQSSAERVLFHVGGTPPPAPTLLSRAFDSEHQNVTFFVLGLVATGTAGAFGVARMQSRRRRLARELAGLEEVYQMTHLRALQCEQALAERLARARSLLLEGVLDETQFAVVARRVEELSRKLRLETIDDQMGFLSVSMARSLRAVLSDGRVERWERAHFLEALDRDEHLTIEQKTRVRALIDEWFARDERGA